LAIANYALRCLHSLRYLLAFEIIIDRQTVFEMEDIIIIDVVVVYKGHNCLTLNLQIVLIFTFEKDIQSLDPFFHKD
jgi:hypothetical protein